LLLLGISITGGRLALFAVSSVSSDPATESTVLIARGTGPSEIARQLESGKVISSAEDFVLVGRLLRKWKIIRMGEYLVSSAMSPLEIFALLGSGKSLQHLVTIREGANMYEIAEALEKEGLAERDRVLSLCRDSEFMKAQGFEAPLPPSLEGYLFPETYSFTRVETPEQMLGAMIRKYRAVWEQMKAKHSARLLALGLSEHQVITLASVIEKETGAHEERPMISSVFHNRLRKKMRLQSDPTTIYGMWERYTGNIHRQDLLTPTPFNTYTIPALPIGPISNPGFQSIEAALNPVESEYLFFVSQNDGRHVFTKSFGEHTAAVKKFQLDPKAREGKSWRDLKQSKI
jgi:UPF0755 protein